MIGVSGREREKGKERGRYGCRKRGIESFDRRRRERKKRGREKREI